ncbi:MAG TPA: 4'-phosphopantetheinyl transferase superfamily protein [Burkholderiales bacterium]|nr:4'-phosphopantetheinyl transferase superfamily protein [Burkholderiales bacterium]
MPRADDFEVAVTRLDASPEEVRFLRALLCAAEKQRAERFRFERDRRRFVVARARLRQLLAARIGMKPEDVELAYGKNGKPCLKHNGWHFSVSHCDDVALFAFSKASEIGVDVEAVRPIREADTIAAQFFSPRENEAYAALAAHDKPLGFLQCWTRKEALVKAIGEGLSMPLHQFDVAHAPGWRLHSFFPLPGFIAAVASHHG